MRGEPRVVYVSRRYPPSVGGMQRLSRELHRALAARLPIRAVAWGGGQRGLPLFLPLAAVRAATWLGAGGDVIVAGDGALAPFGLALGRAFGRPAAAVVHGLDVVYPNPAYQAVVPRALRRMDVVLAISESTRRLALEAGVAPERCLAVGCAIDPDPVPPREVARANLSARLGLELGDRPLLLTVQRLVPRKGVAWFVREVLPKVLASQFEALYLVAGDGPERANVEAARDELTDPGALRVLGRVDDATRADLYGAADLFVMPNQLTPGDAEGFGLVAAEAAHAGLPTVACAVDSIPEVVVEGRTGSLVPPNAPTEMAEAIGALLDDRAMRENLGASARADARERFGWGIVGDRYARALATAAAPC